MTTPSDVEGLAVRVEEMAAEIARLGSELRDLASVVELPAGSGSEDLTPDVLAPVYASMDEWVDQYFLVAFARAIGGELRWCPEWRQHPEAVIRLEALWRSWETMRADPNLGIASWLVSYLDPLLSALLARQGTFASCTPQRHDAALGRVAHGL